MTSTGLWSACCLLQPVSPTFQMQSGCCSRPNSWILLSSNLKSRMIWGEAALLAWSMSWFSGWKIVSFREPFHPRSAYWGLIDTNSHHFKGESLEELKCSHHLAQSNFKIECYVCRLRKLSTGSYIYFVQWLHFTLKLFNKFRVVNVQQFFSCQ